MSKKTDKSERELYLLSIKKNKRKILFFQISVLIVFICLWELLARVGIIDEFITSSPSRIIDVFANGGQSQLLMHLSVTVFETLVGFSCGAILGVCIATILWWSPFLSKVSEPFLVILNSLPKIALGPIIIILVGAGTQAIIVMALAISLIVTVLEMLSGYLSTDRELITMAMSFGASRAQIFFKIIFPSNLRVLMNSLKVNIGLSLVGVIAGEFLVSKAGLGYLIVYGGQVFKMDLVMSSVIILALLAAVMYEGVVFLEKKLIRAIDHSS